MTKYVIHSIKALKAVCWAGCFFFFSCENDMQTVMGFQKTQLSVDEAKHIESFMSQAGMMRAKLTAPRMLRFQDSLPRVEFPNTLHVDFYDAQLQPESFLDAKKGWYYETQNRIALTDSVVVVRINGDTLRTSALYWEQSLKKFYTPNDVSLHSRDKIIYGKGFEADDNLLNYKFDTIRGFTKVAASKFPG